MPILRPLACPKSTSPCMSGNVFVLVAGVPFRKCCVLLTPNPQPSAPTVPSEGDQDEVFDPEVVFHDTDSECEGEPRVTWADLGVAEEANCSCS